MGWSLHLDSRSRNTKPRRWKLNETWTKLLPALSLACAWMGMHVMSEHTQLPCQDASWVDFHGVRGVNSPLVKSLLLTWLEMMEPQSATAREFYASDDTTISALYLSLPPPGKKQMNVCICSPPACSLQTCMATLLFFLIKKQEIIFYTS